MSRGTIPSRLGSPRGNRGISPVARDFSNAVSYTSSMPDAQPAGAPVSWRELHVPPRHGEVWVRIGGTWRKGLIAEWITTGAGTWECLITADEPAGSRPWQGRYVYSAETIRPRRGDAPPGIDSAVLCPDLRAGTASFP